MNPNPSSNSKIYWAIIIIVVLIALGGLYYFYNLAKNTDGTAGNSNQGDTFSGQTNTTTAEQDLSNDVLSGVKYDIKAGVTQ